MLNEMAALILSFANQIQIQNPGFISFKTRVTLTELDLIRKVT